MVFAKCDGDSAGCFADYLQGTDHGKNLFLIFQKRLKINSIKEMAGLLRILGHIVQKT